MSKITLALILSAFAAILYIASTLHRAENEQVRIQQYQPTATDLAAAHGFDNAAKHLKEHKDR